MRVAQGFPAAQWERNGKKEAAGLYLLAQLCSSCTYTLRLPTILPSATLGHREGGGHTQQRGLRVCHRNVPVRAVKLLNV